MSQARAKLPCRQQESARPGRGDGLADAGRRQRQGRWHADRL